MGTIDLRAYVLVGSVQALDAVTGEEPGNPRTITETAAANEPDPKVPRRSRHGGRRSDADHA